MIVVEITCATDASGTLQKFYVSDERFVSSPSDTPPNQAFDNSIMDPGSLGIHTFSDGRTSGSTKLEVGELVLTNIDGQYDSWIDYSFDGRPITIYSGSGTAAYPSGFTRVFTGTMESIDAEWDKIVVRMRDKQYLFSLPLLKTKYAGNNVAPNGLEGTPTDIKDNVKPRVYGKVFNIPCTPVNTSKLIYQVSDGQINAVVAVYDKGAALTLGNNYSTSASLLSTNPAASTYDTCLAEGLFRLGSTPAGTITADVVQGATALSRTVAQIVKSIAMASGVPVGEISAADVSTLDTINSSEVGIYVNDESSFQDCIDQLLTSIGGYCSFDSLGVLRMGVLTAPVGTPVATIHEYETLDGITRSVPKDNGVPAYRATLKHTKNYTVQNSDVAGVAIPRQAYLAEEYRKAKVEDLSIKTKWLLATEIELDTLLTTEAAAIAEADRQLTLYKVPRSLYEFSVDLSLFTEHNLKIMDVITLDNPRFGLQGKLLRILGYRLEIITNKVVLQVWG